MRSEQDPTGEERELLDLLSQSALNDYPNPERIGCPGQAFLVKLATDRKSVSLRDERLHHVLHCSPCFREFRALRVSTAERSGRRKSILFALTAAALVIVAAGLWVLSVHDDRNRNVPMNPNGRPILAQINLQDRAIVRGAPTPPEPKQALSLPRGLLRLMVLLPFGSDPGMYEVQILQDIQKPLLAASGNAEVVNGVTELSVRLDTTPLRPGKFMLGLRRAPLDWTYNPITIK